MILCCGYSERFHVRTRYFPALSGVFPRTIKKPQTAKGDRRGAMAALGSLRLPRHIGIGQGARFF